MSNDKAAPGGAGSANGSAAEKSRGPGRPRSGHVHKKILGATRKLLTHSPLQHLTIEAVAKKAGVGKTTIYRWWPHKAALALDAFLDQPGIQNIMPTAASHAEAVTYQLEALIRQLRGQNGRIIAGIIAESQASGEVLELLYDKFLKERVENLAELVDKGREAGEFHDGIDTDIALDLLLGPLFMRVLSGEHGIDPRFAETFPEQAVKSISAR